MKTNRLFLFVCMAAALVGAALTVLAASKLAKPPTPADVVGTWLGFSDGRVEFMRVDFDADGTGYISISYLRDSPAGLYRIDSWKLDGRTIQISTQPIEAEPIVMRRVGYSYSALEVDLRGKGWKRDATLFREREFSSRAAAVGARIDRYRNDKR